LVKVRLPFSKYRHSQFLPFPVTARETFPQSKIHSKNTRCFLTVTPFVLTFSFMNDQIELSVEQKEYLSGFTSGLEITRARAGLPTFAATLTAKGQSAEKIVVIGPDALAHQAGDAIPAGKKLVPEEIAKRTKHPFDRWDEIALHAEENRFPKGTDVLMWKYHGLFYVAPTQDSFMCRLRFYGGLMDSRQMRAVAYLSEKFGGGYSDTTTRANLQIREIKASAALDFLEELQENGLVARGSGADNIRNITGSPTAGVDAGEIYDTRDLCRQMHHYILNHREMYGLPRKFNIAFDGGGQIVALEDTNDIGFSAYSVGEGQNVPAGTYFRVAFGGITGHKDFARDCGILLQPNQCVPFAATAVRLFIQFGDRTDRKKARLKYLLDSWGHAKFLEETLKEAKIVAPTFPIESCERRPLAEKAAHIGWHSQKQEGLSYVGVLLPVGRLTVAQMNGIAAIADEFGSGQIRLTVWQNLLIIDIPDEKKAEVEAALAQLQLPTQASGVRAGLVACTGSAGCKYANANTKKNALEIADYLDQNLALDQTINLHLTGCAHSCAQHYIGDIGLLGTKVERDDDMVDGYHFYVGGGYGDAQSIGREIVRSIAAEDAPMLTERLLKAYLATRSDVLESFFSWSARHSSEELAAFCAA
jgi:ferredoxin-nitrite reductase